MAAYNDAKYIKIALDSIQAFADEIVIVEGSWLPNRSLRSTDGTLDLINDFRARYPKKVRIIDYIPINEVTKRKVGPIEGAGLSLPYANAIHAREIGLNNLTSDWYFMVDSDEVYKQEDLVRLDKKLDEFIDKEACIIYFNAKVFYFGYDYCTNEFVTRIQKIWGNPPELAADNLIEYKPYFEREKVLPIQCDLSGYAGNSEFVVNIYHYSYTSIEKARIKLGFYKEEVSMPWFNDIFVPTFEYQAIDMNFNYHMMAHKDPAIFGKLEKFDGEHPEAIKKLIEEEMKEGDLV